MNVIEVRSLKKRFNLEAGFFARLGSYVYAVNDVSFSIAEGETYGLVGESGCGKTTTARLLVRMYEADGGEIAFRGEDVMKLSASRVRHYRERVKYVFQDPSRSLDPRMSVFSILTAGLRWSPSWPGVREARKRAESIMEEVGLSPLDLDRRPADFSGGQRQRISIARALLMNPDVLLCDEVVSALDVSIQGQILNLLIDIRRKRGLSILFIAHDLKVACWFCDRIGVMYRGLLMEEAPARDLYERAAHPYTKLLFASVEPKASAEANASAGGHGMAGAGAAGESPAGKRLVSGVQAHGCPFFERCDKAMERCLAELPAYREIAPGHFVRCHFA
jgi:oligopeptide/dipeptide ABC transporter ATP-binding protein